MQASRIMKDDKNTTFSDINETSQKPICVVVSTHDISVSPDIQKLLVLDALNEEIKYYKKKEKRRQAYMMKSPTFSSRK